MQVRCSSGWTVVQGNRQLFVVVQHVVQVLVLDHHWRKSRRRSRAMTTKVVITPPSMVLESRVSDEWGSGICDCCDDVPECCFAFWCCPCFACIKTKEYGQCLCLPLLDICGIVPAATLSMRVSMRHRYGIKGTICNDCLIATCCTSCAWCQMSREMNKRSIPIALINARPTL
ncbi:cornifelin homolog isoform X1 [Astyanax mexicanus]|uniref:cornifelin homolog isoform X1 n=2 Tax=Astyanax mexicanus TaxID=7994 RepID=UPI0020CB3A95|nr:cornifelin homolog isoform X1 [Astyanax mexicanus]